MCNAPPLSIRAIRNAIVITFSLAYNIMCASPWLLVYTYVVGIFYVILVALAEETLGEKSSVHSAL